MKQSYHTDLAIQYRLGILDNEVCKIIPKSTLYVWKNKDFSKLVGSDISLSDEKIELIKNYLSNRTLLRAAKGLFFVYATWITISGNVRGMKSALRKSKETVVKTIDMCLPLLGLKHACKLFGISQHQFYTWKKKVKCALSPFQACHRQTAFNISPSEVQTIKSFVQDESFKEYPLVAVYYEMMREAKAFMSLTAFYKYAKYFDGAVSRKTGKAKPKKGIRAEKPKEIIHADVCIYRPLDYTKCFIYFIADNYSRMILGWKIATEYKSSIMLDNLRNVYAGYHLDENKSDTVLLVDDGIENKGFVSNAIENKELKIIKLIAQKDIHFSNSMIEAVNKRIKYDFLFRRQLFDVEHTSRFLETAVEQYNNRPHSSLYGQTPREVFHGAPPDKTIFKIQMAEAKIKRIAENTTLSCDNCAFIIENQA